MSGALGSVKRGAMAPDFTLLNDQDQTVSLSSFRGRPVVLFFYPVEAE
jgi:peroxiredoxin Q/BCP